MEVERKFLRCSFQLFLEAILKALTKSLVEDFVETAETPWNLRKLPWK